MTRKEIEGLNGLKLSMALACKVMGWPDNYYIMDWRPFDNLNHAAWVMRAKPDWRWGITENYKDKRIVCWLTGAGGETLAQSTALVKDDYWAGAWCMAICRAALFAIEGVGGKVWRNAEA